MIEYRGYLIFGTATKTHPSSPDWRAGGIVWSKTPEGFVLEVARSGGPIFTTKVFAERRGLELCQQWVDETLALQPS